MSIASLRVSSASRSLGTTWLTKPHSAACAASIILPVSSISRARFLPMLRVSATIGVLQNRPILTPGVAKRDVSEATARSQVATSWHPAAVATPSI